MPYGISSIGSRLMLDMMKENVPNGPLLCCQTDQQLVELAVIHGVTVPPSLLIDYSSPGHQPEMIVLPGVPIAPPPPIEEAFNPIEELPGDLSDSYAATSPDLDFDMPSARVKAKPKKAKGRKRAIKAAAAGEEDAPEHTVDAPPSTRRTKPRKAKGRRRKETDAQEADGDEGWGHTPRTAAAL